MAQDAGRTHDVGFEAQKEVILSFKYLVEPVSAPRDMEAYKSLTVWKTARSGEYLTQSDVVGKRVVISFEFSTAVESNYLHYMWAAPLTYQSFVIVDQLGRIIETKVVRKDMLLSRIELPKGVYRAFFIAEPALFSDVKFNFSVMNSAYMTSYFLWQTKFFLLVYGIGLAFVFFNITMFFLHRKSYFIYYVGYSATILWLLAAGSGDLPLFNIYLWNMLLVINCAFMILMSSSVLRLREFYPRLLNATYVIWGIGAILMAVTHPLSARSLWGYGMALGMICYFNCMFAAVRRMQAGYVPAIFFASGWGALAAGYALALVGMFFVPNTNLMLTAYVAYAVESMLFAVALAYRTRDSEQRAIQDKIHALSQLEKVVYPHQIEHIKEGNELESTMPTHSGHACVISFDIMGSSRIKHIRAKEFFRNVFARCNALMSEGYDGKSLRSNAYRIKEMGDGFLCSVGYPFKSMSSNPANDAVDLAKKFASILAEESTMLHSTSPIRCGIGIALDALTGFYPETGTKEYDLYGPALILATRYEGMRKTLFSGENCRSVLIIQEVVFESLDPMHREGFNEFDLKAAEVVVRDDPGATRLYYQYLDHALEPS